VDVVGATVWKAAALLFDNDGVLVDSNAAGIPVPAVIVTSEDVAAGKSAPDPYLLAAERLGLDAAQCAVLEDSANGIAAALAARAGTVIGVGQSALGKGCDVVVPDLSAVRWTGTGVEIDRALERGGRVGRAAEDPGGPLPQWRS
jgi:sugar-phosphatase